MIDYKACDKLIELLDEGDLKKLRKYVNEERNKYYIEAARQALTEYLRRGDSCRTTYYDYHPFTMCDLLLTDGYSAYFLNSAEILTKQRKNKAAGTFHAYSTRAVMPTYEKFSVNQAAVEEIVRIPAGRRDSKPLIDLKTKEGVICTFYEDEFSFAEKFLGKDTEYSVSLDKYKGGGVCLVKSNKGKGFILGRKEYKQF